ncbi:MULTISPECIES: hypothetical protein [Rhodopseudomonas]|uniref:Uncharacterized protein n=1 Tax=Rhodopseudomonas palustris TaxID=1076 RepID=A0A0D7EFR7_RHOPL|nr:MULTISPECIES: hypothetical protein [Rhodopseudomonas]KIZ39583.1 hypothetical protein OO17_19970 [Rhodopseudomonas palustris]MDF3813836.1 hypothetical protein [Rhodopseudomonas sp. BAL398]WOK15428.1 hypothetical protein RBJ75_14630 [Rhodopseudomonas sp. BAL398]
MTLLNQEHGNASAHISTSPDDLIGKQKDPTQPPSTRRQSAIESADKPSRAETPHATPVVAASNVEHLPAEISAIEQTAIGHGGLGHGLQFDIEMERDEIVKRVADFRKLQIKIKLDREQYCDAVLARTRAVLGR